MAAARSSASTDRAWGSLLDRLVAPLLLAAAGLLAIGPRIGLPFVGDDYVFLDKTRGPELLSLVSPARATDFGWYRPWSRELWFWALQHVFGPSPAAFRVASLLLWVAAGSLYFAVACRLANRRTALLTSVGFASAAFWGTPLLWVSACQDLWMLVFVMASLLAFQSSRTFVSLAAFALALLSKETAAVLPGVLVACARISLGLPWREVLRRTWAHVLLLAVWFVSHPTLVSRLFGSMRRNAESAGRPMLVETAVRALTASVNADRMPHAQELGPWVVASSLLMLATLLTGVVLAFREPDELEPGPARRVVAVSLVWAVAGWLPLFLPSIGWHAYYGCFGALGAWLLLASLLRRSRGIAFAAATWASLSRSARAQTPSGDWGDEAYLRRAGSTLAAIRADLQRQRPLLPPGTRVYFAEVPSRIGLVAGSSPALRVWYGDSTLRADYWSRYAPRGPGERPGLDLFFRFDSTRGMVPVHTDPEQVPIPRENDARAVEDHESLARVFAGAGDFARAAGEFEKLAAATGRVRDASCAALCWQHAGAYDRACVLGAAIVLRLSGDAHAAAESLGAARCDLGEPVPGR